MNGDNTPAVDAAAAPAAGQAPEKSPEEMKKEFCEMLKRPLDEKDVPDARLQLLQCDLKIAELKGVIAALRAQIAANEGEICHVELAKAIINRRLANG